jgi:hypothetical protein
MKLSQYGIPSSFRSGLGSGGRCIRVSWFGTCADDLHCREPFGDPCAGADLHVQPNGCGGCEP